MKSHRAPFALVLFALLMAVPAFSLDRVKVGGEFIVGKVLEQNTDFYLMLIGDATNTFLKEDVEAVELDFDQDKYLIRALKLTNEIERIPWLERSLAARPGTVDVVSMLAALYLKYGKRDRYARLRDQYSNELFATLDAWMAVAQGTDPTEVLRARSPLTLAPNDRVLTELLSVRWLAKIQEPERALSTLANLESLFGERAALKWKSLERDESYADLKKRLTRMIHRREAVARFKSAWGDLEDAPKPAGATNQAVKGFILKLNDKPPYFP